MATASGVTTNLARGVMRHVWTLTCAASGGRSVTLSRFPDKTVSMRGTFSGSTITLIGSNQSATVAQASLATQAVHDTRGAANSISMTAPNTVAILENPNLIWPKITTGGAGNISVVVEVVAQSTRR